MENHQPNREKEIRAGHSVELDAVLVPERVLILTCRKKLEVLNALIDCLAQAPEVKDRQALAEGIFRRERLMSTGIGLGIAIPHVRLDTVENVAVAACLCREPIIDYDSLDNQPVRLVFMIAAGQNQHEQHLKLLASLSSRLKDETFRNNLLAAPDSQTFYRILTRKD